MASTNNTNTKFFATFFVNGEKMAGPISADSRGKAEEMLRKLYPEVESFMVQTMSSVLFDRIRENSQKVKFSKDCHSFDAVKERLRCCADLAYLLGYEAIESLDRTLERMVACGDEFTGLDGCMFSFGIRYSGGYYGAVIFHTSSKTWSSHS